MCPRLRNGAACPNAAGVSGVCAVHRDLDKREREKAMRAALLPPKPRRRIPRRSWTPQETIDQVIKRYLEAKARAA